MHMTDLYEGTFQKDGRLDLTGKSQAFRTVMSVTVMLVVLIITKNMIFSYIVVNSYCNTWFDYF